MKTLGKLNHEQRQAPSRAALEAQERLKVKASEWLVWRRRLWLLARLGIAAAVVYGVLHVGFAFGRTAEGLVHGRPLAATAPARVRVTGLLVAPGQRIERGQELLRLEPLDDPQRGVLESQLQRSRVRLDLVKAGANLEEVDTARRWDLLEEARLALSRSRVEEQRTRHSARSLERSRDQLALALQQGDLQQQGTLAVLLEQITGAHAKEAQAVATAKDLHLKLQAREQLAEQGIVPGLELDALRAEVEAADQELLARRSSIEALSQARLAADAGHQLEADRAKAALGELESAIAAAWSACEMAQKEAAMWQETVDRRFRALPADAPTPDELAALELALVRSEVQEAQARLDAHDRQHGRTTLTADVSGVVDRVLVAAGSVVEQGAELVTYFDPNDLWVEVYAPAALASCAPGTEVTLVPEGGGATVQGTVAAIGRIWTTAPAWATANKTDPHARFLPLRLQVDGAALQLNQRLQAVFPWWQ